MSDAKIAGTVDWFLVLVGSALIGWGFNSWAIGAGFAVFGMGVRTNYSFLK